MKKLSLQAQIAEARRTIAEREALYKNKVSAMAMRQGEAEYYQRAMASIEATPVFLQKHRAVFIKTLKQAKEDDAA